MAVLVIAGSWVTASIAQAVVPAIAPTVAQVVTTPTGAATVASPTKPSAPTVSAKPVAVTVAAKSEAKPLWTELTPLQQLALKPLAGNWSTIGEAQKRKWLAVSKNYPSLSAAEQIKMHSRMAEWSSLSQQQRAQARLNFAETKSLSPDEKTANWKAYQALSADEKQKLVAQAPLKPNSAAAAIKPVSPQKLATVPVTRKTDKNPAQLAGTSPAVNQNTLLPHVTSAGEPAVVQKN